MFGKLVKKGLRATKRYGRVDAPSVSESTLEKYNDLYNRMTEGIDSVQVLVLGATPELRDIALEHNHSLTTVERDQQALDHKTSQMLYKGNPNETVMLSDWLTVDLPKDYFDVVMADGALTALPQDSQKELLSLIHRVVKPTGNIILREGTVMHSRPRYAPTVHIHEYRTGQYNLFDLFFGLRLYNTNFESIDTETRRTHLNQFHTKIDEYYQAGLLSQRESEELNSLADELEHTLLRKEDLEDILRQYFFPAEILHDIGSGHLSPWYFFVLEPNEEIEFPDHLPNERYSYVKSFLASQTDSIE